MKNFSTWLLAAAVCAFCSCRDDGEPGPDKGEDTGKDSNAVTTAVVKIKGVDTSFELQEKSTIRFKDNYMIVVNSGKETKIALKDVKSLSYK